MKSYSDNIVDTSALQKMHDDQQTEIDMVKNDNRKLTFLVGLNLVFSLILLVQIVYNYI